MLLTKSYIVTGVTSRHTGDSRADGIEATQLPFPVMSFHIDLLAINHPEVTSDENSLTRLFLTDYSKALSDALNENVNIHSNMIFCGLKAWSGLQNTSSAISQKNRVNTSCENKYSVLKSIGSLPSPNRIFTFSTANLSVFFESSNYSNI